MTVRPGGMKTNFTINHALPLYADGKLLLRDHVQFSSGLSFNVGAQKDHAGDIVAVTATGETVFGIGAPVAYERFDPSVPTLPLTYSIGDHNELDINVPGNLLNKAAADYPLIIDPLIVTNTITGPNFSPYYPAYCTAVNNLSIPLATTITDLQFTYAYAGVPATTANLNQGAFQLSLSGGCTSPPAPYTGEDCVGSTTTMYCGPTNVSFIADVTSCVPVISCNAYTLPVTIGCYETIGVTGGLCSTHYFYSYSPFTVDVYGVTSALPVAISGTPVVCVGGTTTLSDGASTGWPWNSSNTGVATVDVVTGVVTGVATGTATITYGYAPCVVTTTVTVNAITPITGTLAICVGGNTTLSNSTTGGAWSTTPGSGSVTFVSNVATGATAGTANVTYTYPTGCIATAVITVNANPGIINGTKTFCAGSTTTLTDGTAGGAWSTSAGSTTVTVGTGGVVSGATAGTANITYTTGSSCIATAIVTVYALPGTINGTKTFCAGGNTTLTDGTAGGAWSTTAGSTTVTVGTGGLVSGATAGTANITYTIGTCTAATIVTVYAVPGVINGTKTFCAGSNTTLTDGTAGGTWSTSAGSTTVTVGTGGLVSGATAGTANITYTIGGLCTATTIVTVIAVPGTINGTNFFCASSNTTLTDGTAGGTWSTTAGSTTVTVGTGGLVSGATAGTANITYSMGGTCYATAIVTVYAVPGVINGTKTFCAGSNTTLTDATTGGTWSTSAGSTTVTVGTGGLVSGATAGTANITYSMGGTCYATAIVTVYAVPGTINGTNFFCAGSNTTLTDGTAGGTWSTTAGSTTVTVGTGGLVSGATAGTANITYSMGGTCYATAIVTVYAVPGTINGTNFFCAGGNTTLTDGTAGGTWSTSAGSTTVTVGTGGLVSGATAGTANITYTIGGICTATTIVTVIAVPGSINGTNFFCSGSNTTLTDAVAGGTWSTSAGSTTVTVGTGGSVSGATAGTANITYSMGGTCYSTAIVTVYAVPGTINGTNFFCAGSNTTLTDAVTGGTWSTSAGSTTVTVGTGGVVSGATAGTANITYSTGGTCVATAIVTVYAVPGTINGTNFFCAGSNTTLTDAVTGGTWSTSAGSTTVTIGTGGLVSGATAGTANITYTMGGICTATAIVTVYAVPGTINGTPSTCVGNTITLTDAVTGGTWSTTAGSGSVTLGTGGSVTGSTAGTAIVTYSMGGSCYATIIVTVTASPGIINGTTAVCVGLNTTLTDASPGGTWSTTPGSGSVTVGTSGIVTGSTAGTATVSYSTGTLCYATIIVTVNANPTTITGTLNVCAGLTTSLSSAPAGGTWSTTAGSGSVTVGTGGLVTGGAPGTASVTYTLGTGCNVTAIVTVNANPTTITGTLNVCAGLTTSLNSTPAGGTWSTTAGSTTATIGTTGVVTSGPAGTVTVSYTLGTGCQVTTVITVNPLPASISGTLAVCVGTTTTLTDAGGGTWTNTPGTGSVTNAGGLVTGGSAGTATVIYTLGTGCAISAIVTVNPLPATITGTLTVCSGLTTTLSDATTPGTWSSTSGLVTVGSTTGAVTATSASGTAIITYALTATGCITTAVVTINPLPSTISGALTVCVGLNTNLTDAGGGTWLASNTNATIGSTGIATGNTLGTTTITYTLPTGCITTSVLTVNSLPGTITGSMTVCAGLTTTLSDTPGSGTWSSTPTAVATIGSSTGIVTGGSVGVTSTATVTYTIGTGCSMTTIVTVNPLPTGILGTTSVCSGLTTSLTDATGGGIWSSSAPGIASIGSTGIVTGGSVGTASTATITYALTATGCQTTVIVTVNPLPANITGIMKVCSGLTTALTDATAGGAWSSSAGGIATVGTGGIVTGQPVLTTSTATITYTLPTTCIATAVVTVNPLPATITGTLSVCVGLTTTLSDATTPGTWSSSLPSLGSVDVASGVVTGIAPGTTVITYTLPTGCISTVVVTIDQLPNAITGTMVVCQGSITILSDSSPLGNWSSSAPSTASVSGGVVTGTATVTSTATITYTLPTTCFTTTVITVNPLPAAITGTLNVCSGLTTTLSDATTPGTWSSGAPGIASIGITSGVVTAGPSGTATITYKLPTGCFSTAVVTVDPLPSSIAGTQVVCAGLSTFLTDAAGGGTWSGNNANITFGTPSGIVTGVTAGTTVVTYTLPTGCIITTVVTVNPLPSIITGATQICLTFSTNLSDSTALGTWSSDNGNAVIGAGTGIVYGAIAGTSNITYKLTATGCMRATVFTVNPLPAAISGILKVCVDKTTLLTDALTGGTWTSGNNSIGTAGSVSGGITGIAPGTVIITYTLPTGCLTSSVVTVNPIPMPITGINSICYGTTTSLSDVTPAGIWSSSTTSVATVGSTGFVTSTGVGTTIVSYTLSAGCSAIDIVTVNPLPTIYAVTGGGTYCEGGVGVHIGLSGSNVGISYLLYYGPSVTGYLAGTGSPLDFGLLTVGGTYTVRATDNTTGCTNDMMGSALVVITPTVSPTVHITTGIGDTVCPGTAVTFSPIAVNGGLAPTYSWSVNGVLVSLGNSYTFIPADGDVISVTMTSNGTCVAPLTATGVLKIRVFPDANPSVNISIDPGDTICQFAAATFTATPTFGGPAPVYMWYVNGVAQSGSGPMFSYYPNTGDVVYCKMVSDYLCRLSDTGYSNVAVMTVSPMIIPHVDIIPVPSFFILAGQNDTLTTLVANAGPNPTYQWKINGTPIYGATSATFISQFHDYDSVTCVVTSSGVCEGISTFDWVYITVTPLGVQQYATGTADIRLLPNPNNGTFTIRGTFDNAAIDREASMEITDMMGQVVYRNKAMIRGGKLDEQLILDNTLSNGMYLLNFRSGSDNRVFHFVIRK